MKVSLDLRVTGLCAIGCLILLSGSGCGDDEGETDGGVSYSDAAGGDEGGSGGRTGGAGRGTAGRGGAGGGGAGEGGTSGSAAGNGAVGGTGGRTGGSGRGGVDGDSDAGIDESDAGMVGGEAGSGGTGEAGSGGEAEAGSGGTGEAGSGGAGEAGSGGAGEAGSGGTGEAGSGSTAGRCGTRGGVMCSEGEFCNFEPDELCGATDRGGVCEDRPEFCTAIFDPVCGCDNRTYGNACEAHGEGVSVKREGMCSPEECADAGGRAVYSMGANTPECAQGEESWSISGGIEPVICCLPDEPSGVTCGGIAMIQCDDGEFCNVEEEVGGQGCDGTIVDGSGVCQNRPAACTREYNPVCGCDRKSYGNACTAHANGMSILHENACNEIDCAAMNGRVVYGLGPAPMCDPDETEYTYVIDSSGAIPIEGAVCCVPN